jgi:hypothetical protein
MLHGKESVLYSFFHGKSFTLTASLFSAYIPQSLLFPVKTWPPSLVPTWKTTVWTGVCFSHAKKGACSFLLGQEANRADALIFHQLSYRETSLMAANARAPP